MNLPRGNNRFCQDGQGGLWVRGRCSLLVLFLGMAPAMPHPSMAATSPFAQWRDNSVFRDKVLEAKKILVDATTRAAEDQTPSSGGEGAKPKALMAVSAVGYVGVPFSEVKGWIRNYPDLKNVDERFREVRWDQAKRELFLHLEAYSYHARMTLKVTETETPPAFLMTWESIDGSFVGMKGVIRVEKEGRGAVLSLDSSYSADRLPLPQVLMGPGLEFVASRVAGKMRSYLEDKWNQPPRPK